MVRFDSAANDQNVLDHWENRHWDFTVSAEMHQQLKQEIERLPGNAWHLWKMYDGGVIREWAEVPYVPARRNEEKR